jgi:flagellar hook protein FlgE
MFSAIYTGATGLKAQSQSLGVTGNNIANVSTTAFKGSTAYFANLMSQTLSYGSAATDHETGYSQVGLGVGLEDIKIDFSQGSFETTNTSTNIAIGGKGFFKVTDGGNTYYSRAGDFEFDENGYMIDPSGAQLQGRSITNGVTSGASSSIKLNINEEGMVTMPAKGTTQATIISNLSATEASSTSATNPYFSLTESWNGLDSETPLSSSQYSYSTSLNVYDENGEAHTVTVYYDKINSSDAGGKNLWQYIVTMDPSEDTRSGFQGTSNAGLLMTGTLTFNSSGVLESQSAFTYSGSGDPASLTNWTPSSFSADGYPQFSATTSNGALTMGVNLGLTNTGAGWTNTVSNAAAVGYDPSALPAFASTRAASATTAYSGTSSTTKLSQDGYASGVMQSISIDQNGVLSGVFSNGQTDALYQIDLYYFTNEYGLRSEGNNHYSATTDSGVAYQGTPGSDGLGTLTQYSLEQSNVDLATEFVTMISTQRAFEMNSKVITTADSVIQEALNIKR